MRADDLDLRELLEFHPQGGVIRFARERALILDAVALGLLRKEFIDTLGLTAAKGVLTRFGYAHGWRTAGMLKEDFPWDSELEWRKAGARFHELQGVVSVKPIPGPDERFVFRGAIWHDSYEAEQHLLHCGQAEEPVCWTLCGYASAHMTYTFGQELFCVEEKCIGKGDAYCKMIACTRAELGETASTVLSLYQKDLDAVLEAVTGALKRTEQELHSRRKELDIGLFEAPAGMVVQSEAMKRIITLTRRVAKVDSTVLFTGESGVGKERLARFLYQESPRAHRPFIAINCGAVPENLLESELFGHTKGAFTDAVRDRQGLFEAANEGTLFLDEVGDLPQSTQVKLLRTIQEREIRRLGENKVRSIDVRIVAATNRDLGEEVAAKRFREDLYYRLRVVPIAIPPLRERKEDILPLARALLAAASRRLRRKIAGFTPAALQQLLRYHWPGNVRELENTVERAVALATGDRVDVEDLPDEVKGPSLVTVVPGTIRPLGEVERGYILAALKVNGGNKTKTARQLGLSSATLFRRLKAYGADAA